DADDDGTAARAGAARAPRARPRGRPPLRDRPPRRGAPVRTGRRAHARRAGRPRPGAARRVPPRGAQTRPQGVDPEMNHHTVTTTFQAPRDEVFAYLADIERLPEWATEFARELKLVDGRHKVVNGLREFLFELRAGAGTGVI